MNKEETLRRLQDRVDVLSDVSRYYVTGQGCFELQKDLQLAIDILKGDTE